MKIAVLGGGSWGSALAIHLAKKKYDVNIWEFFEEQAKSMQEKRCCPFLPKTKFPDNITVSSKMQEVIEGSDLVFLVVPSRVAEVTVKNAVNFIGKQPLIIATKGFSNGSKLLTDEVGKLIGNKIYCLFGPTHAEEVSLGMFSSIVLAGEGDKTNLQKTLESNEMKVELSDDIIGVQVSAALKNSIAILIGIINGSGLGDNAKAIAMTKGLAEIKQLGLKMGAKEETFYSLAGLGDLIVTCTSQHSRNFRFGKEIGKGNKVNDVLNQMKMEVEGLEVLKQVLLIEERNGIKLPLLHGTHDLIYNECSKNKIEKLLASL